MDIFEQGSAFYDVIVLQTVLEEVKTRSLALFSRLMTLVKSVEKRFYVFYNEFRVDTYVRRRKGESINDRNDRAIRTAAKWYAQHLPRKKCPTIVVLTDDQANLQKTKADGVTSAQLADYVSSLEDADRLLDMISDAQQGQEQRPQAGQAVYPEYYSTSRLMTGINAGLLHQGIFQVSPYNYLEGTVHTSAFEKPLLVLGRENSNRSISGDSVVVEVLPKEQWKAPSTKMIDEEALNPNEDADAEEAEAVTTERERRALLEEVTKAHGIGAETRSQPTARVVGVLKRNWRQYVGTIDANSAGTSAAQGRKQQTLFLLPMDKRIPRIRIRTRQANELVGKRILATIDSWDRDTRHPIGHYVRSLGDLETKEAETEALLLEYDVQYRPFPKMVLDCLPAEGHAWKVPPQQEWIGRKDLRELLVCSIDPPGCQDIDDALHARRLSNGNFEVGVHIADVSHFVQPGNAMDQEASARGTTVYLVDKRIDMLPMLLGTDLCSLKPDVERYAFSTIWEVTPDADVVSASFTKSVILSRGAFSYEQAQTRIDDRALNDELTSGMRILLMLSEKLRQKRMAAGALNLSSPEVRIETDSETSDAMTDVKTKALLATNSLVEEFMLLANITVARKIQTSFPSTALLRRHVAPPASNFAELSEQLKQIKGFELDVSSSKALADSLDQCQDPAHPFLNTLVRILTTRCMTSAEYFCSGSHAEVEYRHYGLASDIYTHFTSPIRRYADLLVHRQLSHAIGYHEQGGTGVIEELRNKPQLDAVCKNLNVRHRNAQFAGRASIEYYVGQALKTSQSNSITTDGYVMRVFENGAVIFVPRFGIEGVVRLNDFDLVGASNANDEKDEGFGERREGEFEPQSYRLTVWAVEHGKAEVGKSRARMSVQLFQQVKVRVGSEEKVGKRDVGKRKVSMVVLG